MVGRFTSLGLPWHSASWRGARAGSRLTTEFGACWDCPGTFIRTGQSCSRPIPAATPVRATASPLASNADRRQAPAEPAPGQSSHLRTIQLIEYGEYVGRLRPAGIIRIDLRICDDAVLPDHVS